MVNSYQVTMFLVLYITYDLFYPILYTEWNGMNKFRDFEIEGDVFIFFNLSWNF